MPMDNSGRNIHRYLTEHEENGEYIRYLGVGMSREPRYL